MRNLQIIILLVLTLISTSACGDFDEVIYDPNTDQTFVFFSEAQTSLIFENGAPETGTVEVEVGVSSLRENNRTIQISVDEELTDATLDQYSFENTVSIPSNEYFGTFTVSGVYDNLPTSNVELVLIIESIDEDGASISQESHTVLLRRTN